MRDYQKSYFAMGLYLNVALCMLMLLQMLLNGVNFNFCIHNLHHSGPVEQIIRQDNTQAGEV